MAKGFKEPRAGPAIAAALERINAHVMRRISVSRRQLFETVEMPVLAPLPDADYQFAEWLLARVSLDFGGVPRLVVPDNLKSSVHRASFYDPEINRSYGMMASGIIGIRSRGAICRRSATFRSGRTASISKRTSRTKSNAFLVLIGATQEGRKELVGSPMAPARARTTGAVCCSI